jgi:hypothetical protein
VRMYVAERGVLTSAGDLGIGPEAEGGQEPRADSSPLGLRWRQFVIWRRALPLIP